MQQVIGHVFIGRRCINRALRNGAPARESGRDGFFTDGSVMWLELSDFILTWLEIPMFIDSMNCPPLIGNVSPVIQMDSSATRNTTARAISSGFISLPIGIWAIMALRISSGMAFTISVSVYPGAMALTVMPLDALSRAKRLGKPDDACLRRTVIGLTCLSQLPVHRADADDAPVFLLAHGIDDGAHILKQEVRLVVMTAFQFSGVILCIMPSLVIPALLTRISTFR